MLRDQTKSEMMKSRADILRDFINFSMIYAYIKVQICFKVSIQLLTKGSGKVLRVVRAFELVQNELP